jgi:flagellin-like protein
MLDIKQKDDSGVSPVIGVILMVAVTVALVALVTVAVFNIGGSTNSPPEPTPVDVQYESESAITVRILSEPENNVIVQSALGTEYELSGAGDSVTILNQDGNQTPVAFGQNDAGERTVIQTIPPQSFTPDRVVKSDELIQPALDNAQDGDIIVLQRDTYKESLSISTDNVTLVGEEGTVLDSSTSTAVDVTGQNVRISNVKVNGNGGTSTGISGQSDTSVVRSTIENVGTKLSGGVQEITSDQFVPAERLSADSDSGESGGTSSLFTPITEYSYNGDSEALDVSSQDSRPKGISFNNDGSKLYVVGLGNDKVYEYDLSTPYDVSTASYSGNSEALDVSSQDSAPQGMALNNDGSKLYIIGQSNSNVLEYDLSTPYDISTGSFSGNSLDVSSEDNYPNSMSFNDDGSKLYVLGQENNNVLEYDLSTPYDISTGSFSGNSLDVSSADNYPDSMAFNDDGSKLYILGEDNSNVLEYDLSTPYDISTGSFSGNSLDVSSEDSEMRGILFNDDGSKLYVAGIGNSNVYEYSNGNG